MSWWVSITDPTTGVYMIVDSFTEGGTYAIGGSSEADLNVTYNYSGHFHQVLGLRDGLRSFDGMKVEDALPILKRAIPQLDTDVSNDYWEPTEGNARKVLEILEGWCGEAVVRGIGEAVLRVA